MSKRSLTTLLTLALSGSALAAQTTTVAPPEPGFAGLRTLLEPLPRLEDTGRVGFVSSWYDAGTYEAFRAASDEGGATRLSRFPLPGGATVELLLRPVTIWEPGGTARVVTRDGGEIRVAPTARMFAVHVPGRLSRGFLGLSEHMAQGYLMLEGVNYLLSTGESTGETTGKRLTITHADAFSRLGYEGVPQHGDTQEHGHLASPAGSGSAPAPGPADATDSSASTPEPAQRVVPSHEVWESVVFVECDKRVRNRFATEQEVVDYVTILLAAANEIYRRDAGFRLVLPDGYVRVSNGIDDLWAPTPYEIWFNSPSNPLFGIPRGHVNRLTGFGRGSAAGSPICTGAGDQAFNVVEVKGSFPYPLEHTSTHNWDLYANGMENGHMIGSAHTQNYHPPIPCDDGSGPDEGTLMSYCAFASGLWTPRDATPEKIGMRFHARVQEKVRSFFRNNGCIPSFFPTLGDYDENGIHDLVDLAEFDAVSNQGFRSISAEALFDLNRDGVMDGFDRALLVGMLVPPATSSIHNGSGVNCLCFGVVTQPVMGGTWTTVVGNHAGPPILTGVLGSRTRLQPPVATKHGELLVALTGFGGETLFRSWAWTSGGVATHENRLPYDAAFVGVTVEAQAALLTPAGLKLTNALTLTFSTY